VARGCLFALHSAGVFSWAFITTDEEDLPMPHDPDDDIRAALYAFIDALSDEAAEALLRFLWFWVAAQTADNER
jgi:hypothetical protein